MERVYRSLKYIIICCVLHNTCLLKTDDFTNIVELSPEFILNHDQVGGISAVSLGVLKRDDICDRFSIHNV